MPRRPFCISILNYISIFRFFFKYSLFIHLDIILNRSNNSVFLLQNLLKSASVWSRPGPMNLSETWNASSPGFFPNILNLIFQSISMDVDYKLLLQLFLIGFCLFCSNIGKKISIEISFDLKLLLRWSAQFSFTSRKSSANPRL